MSHVCACPYCARLLTLVKSAVLPETGRVLHTSAWKLLERFQAEGEALVKEIDG